MLVDDLQRKGMEAAGFVDIQEFNYKVWLDSSLHIISFAVLAADRASPRY